MPITIMGGGRQAKRGEMDTAGRVGIKKCARELKVGTKAIGLSLRGPVLRGCKRDQGVISAPHLLINVDGVRLPW